VAVSVSSVDCSEDDGSIMHHTTTDGASENEGQTRTRQRAAIPLAALRVVKRDGHHFDRSIDQASSSIIQTTDGIEASHHTRTRRRRRCSFGETTPRSGLLLASQSTTPGRHTRLSAHHSTHAHAATQTATVGIAPAALHLVRLIEVSPASSQGEERGGRRGPYLNMPRRLALPARCQLPLRARAYTPRRG